MFVSLLFRKRNWSPVNPHLVLPPAALMETSRQGAVGNAGISPAQFLSDRGGKRKDDLKKYHPIREKSFTQAASAYWVAPYGSRWGAIFAPGPVLGP
jgi:hypothetical protein